MAESDPQTGEQRAGVRGEEGGPAGGRAGEGGDGRGGGVLPRSQRGLLTGDLSTIGHSSGFYPTSPTLSTTLSFVPRDGTRVRCYSTTFSFGEVLPWYPMG